MGANPADALKEVAKELKEKFDEAGMGSVNEFVEKLESVKKEAATAPKRILDEVQEKFKSVEDKLQEVIKNPASLAPEGGGMAACASWYGSSVAGKLGPMADETTQQLAAVQKMASDVMGPMKSLGETLESAMEQLAGSLSKLAKLPAEVGELASTVDSPDAIAKIDVDPLKKCLDISGIDSPLDSIVKLKDVIEGAVVLVSDGIRQLIEFVQRCPGLIRSAFDVPFPLCCMTSALMSQAPAPMKDMLDMVAALEKVDTQALLDIMQNISQSVCNMDMAAIKTPIEKFSSSAKESVDKLEKTVGAAKLASNPMGAIPGM